MNRRVVTPEPTRNRVISGHCAVSIARRRAWLTLGGMILAACGGETRSISDGVADATSSESMARDASQPSDSSGDVARVDATTCPSIATYCASDASGCVDSWATARQTSTWCSAGPYPPPLDPVYSAVFVYTACDGYNVVVLVNDTAGTGAVYFYEIATGALAGVGTGVWNSDGLTSETCVAGHIVTNAADTWSLYDCPDAGTFAFPVCSVCTTCNSP